MSKIAFVFPGQGSQTVGMMDSWDSNETVQKTLARASDALGTDLKTLMHEGPAEELNLTTNTQPVMLASSYAVYCAWLEAGGARPELLAGHSLGEYTAYTAADALQLEDAVKIVRVRADAMQQAVPVGTGGMAAILGLDDETVVKICQQAAQSQSQVVEPVNFNAPAQVVIAGHAEAIERACQLAKEAGAKRALPLPVSAPFHSSLLKPAAAKLQAALSQAEIKSPSIPVINNVDVAISTEPSDIIDTLVRQAYHPVQWVKTIQSMKQKGVTHIVECGPGKVLAGLVKRIDREIQVLGINDPDSLQQTLETISN